MIHMPEVPASPLQDRRSSLLEGVASVPSQERRNLLDRLGRLAHAEMTADERALLQAKPGVLPAGSNPFKRPFWEKEGRASDAREEALGLIAELEELRREK